MILRHHIFVFILTLFLSACTAHKKPLLTSEGPTSLPDNVRETMVLAEKGDAYAQLELGKMHLRGEGVRIDKRKGVSLIEQAASQGLPDAYGHLGMIYFSGDGVRRNKKKSNYFYEKAAELGEPGWLINLGFAYERGSGVHVDEARSYAYFYLASLMGSTDMYHQPEVLARDMPMETLIEGMQIAKEWWKKHCYNATWSHECADDMETRIYLDRKNMFNIAPPPNWAILSKIGKGQSVLFQGKATLVGGSHSAPKIFIRAEELATHTDGASNAYAETNITRLYQNFKITSRQRGDFNGYTADMIGFHVDAEIIELRGIQATIKCDTILYSFTTVSPADKWDENEEIFLQSLNTFTCFN